MDIFSIEIISLTSIVLTVSGLSLCFILFQTRQLPPGPWGIPLLGCLPFWKGLETNMEWYRKYGDIYSVKLGPRLIVYLNSMSLVNKYLKNSDVFINKPPGPAAIGQGLLFGSGEKYDLNRKLCHQSLRGVTAEQTFNQHFQDDAVELMAQLEECACQEVNLIDKLRPCIVNGISTLIKGSRYSYTDPKFVDLVSVLREVDNVDLLAPSTLFSLTFPKLWSRIPHRSIGLQDILTELQSQIRTWIVKRRKSADETESQDVLIDSFLNSKEYQDINSSDDEMVQSAIDMFNGGLAASLSGLEFLFLYLIHYPDIQSRIQTEIDDVIGCDRKPCWADRSKLPYTAATINETLRLACITPSTLPHLATDDATVRGYHVPKGAGVVASIFCVHHQSALYDNPESFNPERFLNTDSNVLTPNNIIPFGVEPRYCPGEKWFHVYTFLILASILQRYNVRQPERKELPPFVSRIRIVRRLQPYTCVLIPRANMC